MLPFVLNFPVLTAQYVNNPTLSDITFLVEGRKFHAHRIALLASSDAFRAMFSGGYREKVGDTSDRCSPDTLHAEVHLYVLVFVGGLGALGVTRCWQGMP